MALLGRVRVSGTIVPVRKVKVRHGEIVFFTEMTKDKVSYTAGPLELAGIQPLAQGHFSRANTHQHWGLNQDPHI